MENTKITTKQRYKYIQKKEANPKTEIRKTDKQNTEISWSRTPGTDREKHLTRRQQKHCKPKEAGKLTSKILK